MAATITLLAKRDSILVLLWKIYRTFPRPSQRALQDGGNAGAAARRDIDQDLPKPEKKNDLLLEVGQFQNDRTRPLGGIDPFCHVKNSGSQPVKGREIVAFRPSG